MIKENVKRGVCKHGWERLEMNKKFRSENLKVRDHSEDAGADGQLILE
jgi:hypothetical protein